MPDQTEPPATWKDRIACECNHKDQSAAIWPIIRLVIIAIVGFVAFSCFYSHGFDPAKDGASLAAFLLASGLIDIVKRFIATGDVVANKPSEPNGDN